MIKKYVDENLLNNYFFEFVYERFETTAFFKVNTYTDVFFNIAKEGYTPISLMPRTSGNEKVVLVGYGFGENDAEHTDINRDLAAITFYNTTSTTIEGGVKLDVIYINHSLLDVLIPAEEVNF